MAVVEDTWHLDEEGGRGPKKAGGEADGNRAAIAVRSSGALPGGYEEREVVDHLFFS